MVVRYLIHNQKWDLHKRSKCMKPLQVCYSNGLVVYVVYSFTYATRRRQTPSNRKAVMRRSLKPEWRLELLKRLVESDVFVSHR